MGRQLLSAASRIVMVQPSGEAGCSTCDHVYSAATRLLCGPAESCLTPVVSPHMQGCFQVRHVPAIWDCTDKGEEEIERGCASNARYASEEMNVRLRRLRGRAT